MTRNLIQVYHDIGSDAFSTKQLIKALKAFSGKFKVMQTTGELLRSHQSNLEETILLCFGGGYDLGYLSSLRSEGCAVVRNYISSGGRYLGLCAGAYFASKRCVFDEHGPNEVVGDRPIGLFFGDAVGPYAPGFQYSSEEGSHAVPVVRCTSEMMYSDIPNALCYINGGCAFRSTDWTHADVLYCYGNSNDPAIIASRLGGGIGVLSGVHLEYNPDDLDQLNAGDHSHEVACELRTDDEKRLQLWHAVLSFLLGTVN
ncbi:Biotin-protein ligase [Fasciola hepatica]|uniref:Biotin-protein ligase n=1 Tax=Fasciola hepatica TaxID=6192 RepID=A0A4E0RQ47_FASHE|nr:Biotin-protein ligase [Fasciola hepatica]